MKIKKYFANLLLIKNLILFIPLIFDKELKELVYKDLDVQDYQCRYKKTRSILFVNFLLCFDYSFRAIYQFRLRNHIVTWIMSRIFVPNKLHIEISGKIGGGLRIFHGQNVVIHLHQAGENLSVWQGVTIGRNPKTVKDNIDIPTFGNNVNVYTNSVVIGNITIGDNVSIGAGTVVYKDVPSNSTVISNSMKIIQK